MLFDWDWSDQPVMESHKHRHGRNQSSYSTAGGTGKSRSNQAQFSKSAHLDRRSGNSSSDSKDAGSLKISTKIQEDVDTVDSSSAPSIIGSCPFMCPESERHQREQLRDLALFERLHGNPRKSSADLAVKKFCRTISTKHFQASDIRPIPILEMTLKYLLSLLDQSDLPFQTVHDFIFDRTRSIRQDLSMQNIVNEKAIHIYEEIVKFHVISSYRLRRCACNSDIESLQYLNMEQLTKTLISLFNMYEVNISSSFVHKNEDQFRSLYVLLHLDSQSKPTGESLSLWFRRLSSSTLRSKEMSFSRKILKSFCLGNYRHFLCTIASEASYLQYCIIEPYISEIRAMALSCINSAGYKLHPFPLVGLSQILLMKEPDLESFCKACGLEIVKDELGNKVLPLKQSVFHYSKGDLESCSLLGCNFDG